jgi:hypothetical protein
VTAALGPAELYVAAVAYGSVAAVLARLVELKREKARSEVVRE